MYEPEPKFEKYVDVVLSAWRHAADLPALLYQLKATLAAAMVAYLSITLALWLVRSGGMLKALGFVAEVAGLGVAGLLLAAGAVAVNLRALGKESGAGETMLYIERSVPALVQCCGAFYAAFALVLCLLLVPTAAARLGLLGQMAYALLLLPITALAAAGVLALVAGIALVPAELALNGRDTGETFRNLQTTMWSQARSLLTTFAVAVTASAAIALPILAVLSAANACLGASVLLVGGISLRPVPSLLAGLSSVAVIAVAAAPPLVCLNSVVALRYREMSDAARRPPQSADQAEV